MLVCLLLRYGSKENLLSLDLNNLPDKCNLLPSDVASKDSNEMNGETAIFSPGKAHIYIDIWSYIKQVTPCTVINCSFPSNAILSHLLPHCSCFCLNCATRVNLPHFMLSPRFKRVNLPQFMLSPRFKRGDNIFTGVSIAFCISG